jgi:hypothetical protein
MIKPITVLRTIGRIAIGLAASIIGLGAIWFTANRVLDESPDPRRVAYLSTNSDKIPDPQNIAVGILGLTAPSGSDFMQYGAQAKAVHETNATWSQVQAVPNGPKDLQPTVESNQVLCWLDPDSPPWKGCLPVDQVPLVLQENRELLTRYKELYFLDDYANADTLFNQSFLIVLELSIAEMRLDLRQRNYESAYRKCRNQLLFVRKILRGADGFFGKSIGLVAVGYTLPVLDDILSASPNIAKEHGGELLALLRPENTELYNPESTARAEFALVNRFLQSPSGQKVSWDDSTLSWMAFHLGQKNRMLNRLFVFFQEYGSALRLPWKQMNMDLDRLRENYVQLSDWDFVIDPFGSMFVRQQMRTPLQSQVSLAQMYILSGKFRLTSLMVRIVNDNVRDGDIPQFLVSANQSLYDPFSEKPMRWDGKARSICFSDPNEFPVCVRVPALGAIGNGIIGSGRS